MHLHPFPDNQDVPQLKTYRAFRFCHAMHATNGTSQKETTYRDIFGQEAKFESVHAGLECGYFSEKFPGMDMIACGPTITGAHTPHETLDLESLVRLIQLLISILERA